MTDRGADKSPPHPRYVALLVGVPVAFVDGMLPHLKDTEARVFLVVLRQTRVIGKEREAAWLTHGELCRRTGRAGEAVSAAIAALVEKGLLEVRDEAGRVLATAQDRQLAPGRRFYRAARPLLNPPQNRDQGKPVCPPVTVLTADKAKTIETNQKNSYCLRKSEAGEVLASGLIPELSAEQKARIEVQKEQIRERLRTLSAAPGPR